MRDIIATHVNGSITFNGKRDGWDTVTVHAEGYVCELTARTRLGLIVLTLPEPKRIGVDALPSIEIRQNDSGVNWDRGHL